MQTTCPYLPEILICVIIKLLINRYLPICLNDGSGKEGFLIVFQK